MVFWGFQNLTTFLCNIFHIWNDEKSNQDLFPSKLNNRFNSTNHELKPVPYLHTASSLVEAHNRASAHANRTVALLLKAVSCWDQRIDAARVYLGHLGTLVIPIWPLPSTWLARYNFFFIKYYKTSRLEWSVLCFFYFFFKREQSSEEKHF